MRCAPSLLQTYQRPLCVYFFTNCAPRNFLAPAHYDYNINGESETFLASPVTTRATIIVVGVFISCSCRRTPRWLIIFYLAKGKKENTWIFPQTKSVVFQSTDCIASRRLSSPPPKILVWKSQNVHQFLFIFTSTGLFEIVFGLCRRQHLRRTAPDAQTAAQRIFVGLVTAGWQTPLFRQSRRSGGSLSRIRVAYRWVRSSAPGNGRLRLRSPTGRWPTRRSTVTRSLARYRIRFFVLNFRHSLVT